MKQFLLGFINVMLFLFAIKNKIFHLFKYVFKIIVDIWNLPTFVWVSLIIDVYVFKLRKEYLKNKSEGLDFPEYLYDLYNSVDEITGLLDKNQGYILTKVEKYNPPAFEVKGYHFYHSQFIFWIGVLLLIKFL